MYDLDWLLGQVDAKKRQKYLYFWGHRPTRSGELSGSCLSQWWPAKFTVGGVTYATAEHWMMAGKARLFGDEKTARQIVAATHPDQAKKLGRQVQGFDEETWRQHRRQLVVDGNHAKFSQHADLLEFLLGTGSRVLVEASPVDRVWGIGLAADDERADNPRQWRGLNLLGFALMDVRDALLKPNTSAAVPKNRRASSHLK